MLEALLTGSIYMQAVRKWMKENYSDAKMVNTFSDVEFASGSKEVALEVLGEGVRTDEGWHIFPNPEPASVNTRTNTQH